jgi:predicted nuclease of predicted toxin-antitoxin system
VRVVLDHCVPWGLARLLAPAGHEVAAVAALGLEDSDDGLVLDRIAGRCDAFVTVDRNLPFQQRLAGRPFPVLVLRGRSNRLADLAPLAPALLAALATAPAGRATLVGV